MSYESDQDKWIKEVGLRVGDKVLVVASAERHSNGWMNSWNDDYMTVGTMHTVISLFQHEERPEQGIQLDTKCGYPFFVLVKIN